MKYLKYFEHLGNKKKFFFNPDDLVEIREMFNEVLEELHLDDIDNREDPDSPSTFQFEDRSYKDWDMLIIDIHYNALRTGIQEKEVDNCLTSFAKNLKGFGYDAHVEETERSEYGSDNPNSDRFSVYLRRRIVITCNLTGNLKNKMHIFGDVRNIFTSYAEEFNIEESELGIKNADGLFYNLGISQGKINLSIWHNNDKDNWDKFVPKIDKICKKIKLSGYKCNLSNNHCERGYSGKSRYEDEDEWDCYNKMGRKYKSKISCENGIVLPIYNKLR